VHRSSGPIFTLCQLKRLKILYDHPFDALSKLNLNMSDPLHVNYSKFGVKLNDPARSNLESIDFRITNSFKIDTDDRISNVHATR